VAVLGLLAAACQSQAARRRGLAGELGAQP
jgi:hypothetical protein